jgi:hypothetical protein
MQCVSRRAVSIRRQPMSARVAPGLIVAAMLAVLPGFAAAQSGIISTVAGTDVSGFNGDGIPASAAQLVDPYAAAFDSAGNLYIAEFSGNRIRRVDAATGLISTVAGTGAFGDTPDGGQATAAQLYLPMGLAVDGDGRLFIADHQNFRVRAVVVGSVAPVDGPPYTLTITPPTGGKVQGAGINCGAGGTACSVTMPAQMTLGLAATPSAGYTFGAWTGNCSGASPSLWLDLKGARTCRATFTPK